MQDFVLLPQVIKHIFLYVCKFYERIRGVSSLKSSDHYLTHWQNLLYRNRLYVGKISFSQNCHTIRTKELIYMRVCVFSNYNSVLLQFYAQFYSYSIQMYHCKNHMISLYFYHSIKFQLRNLCKGLKNNLHIEKKCITIIGIKGWKGWEQS